MTYAAGAPDLIGVRRRRASRGSPLRSGMGSAALAFGIAAGAWWLSGRPVMVSKTAEAPQGVRATVAAATLPLGLFGPDFSSGLKPASLADNPPLASDLQWSRTEVVAAADPEPVLALPAPPVSPLVEAVPLPTPRPPEFSVAVDGPPVRLPGRQSLRPSRTAAAPAVPADNRGFFEKLFGGSQQPAGPALAYAAPEPGPFAGLQTLNATPTPPDRLTAVYDIAAHTVYMPDGTRLEAHSGLGSRLDDPRFVHERMHGPTPPSVYELKLREQLFHGVKALRLTPVGGGSTFGRTGLLAHSYMLGPNGDSNGCVSFRNYDSFLQAFQNGGVKRLAVVARRT